MGGAVLYTIMLLIAPLAVRSSCLGPYSRCRVGSDSARVDHDLPQLKTAQRQLLFQCARSGFLHQTPLETSKLHVKCDLFGHVKVSA